MEKISIKCEKSDNASGVSIVKRGIEFRRHAGKATVYGVNVNVKHANVVDIYSFNKSNLIFIAVSSSSSSSSLLRIYRRNLLIKQTPAAFIKNGPRSGMLTTGSIFAVSHTQLHFATNRGIEHIDIGTISMTCTILDLPCHSLCACESMTFAVDSESTIYSIDNKTSNTIANVSLKYPGSIASGLLSIGDVIITTTFNTIRHANTIHVISHDRLSICHSVDMRHRGQHVAKIAKIAVCGNYLVGRENAGFLAFTNFFANHGQLIFTEIYALQRIRSKKIDGDIEIRSSLSYIDMISLSARDKVCYDSISIEDRCLILITKLHVYRICL